MEFCDLQCVHARFPKEEALDGARSCRTFAALYCRKKKTYVHKNMPCREKVQKKSAAPGGPFLLAALLGIASLGASGSGGDAVAPYFPDGYEQRQMEERRHRQRYHEGILITGTAGYISRVREALELIEDADGRNWYFVRKHVRRITLTGHTGMDVGGGRFTSGDGEGETTSWLAGKIVHDAWHRELYFRGRPWEGREAEVFCLEKQREFLNGLDDDSLDVEEALRSEYWKVDYWARDW